MKAEPPAKVSVPLSIEERRQRRAEKREKQRAANVGRAKKMHEARLEGQVKAGTAVPPALNIGCSGWFYWHWRGSFYPSELPTGKWFTHYKRRFRTVEINASFYSWPTVNAVKQWIKQAGSGSFIYTVKACEIITHVKRFSRTKTLVLDFGFIADLLGDKMGCFLFQLPPSYHYTPARLKAILGQLDTAHRNVIEFRHRSWWNERVYQAFKKAGAIFCSCSAPRLPEELVVTTDEVYIRFHGRSQWYRHDYSDDELAVWAERIMQSGCRRVWAYFNNDREAFAIKNARRLLALLKKAGFPVNEVSA